MGETAFFRIEKITANSREHNLREIIPDYVNKDLMHLNSHFYFDDQLELIPFPDKTHSQIKVELSEIYKKSTGQKVQEKTNLIMEALLLFSETNTDAEILEAVILFAKKHKLRLLELHIHRDEGHSRAKSWIPNLHAHLVFENIERNDVFQTIKKKGEEEIINLKGKTHKFSKTDLSRLQDFFAEQLNLKRGKIRNREHLSHIEYKNKIVLEEIKKGEKIFEESHQKFELILKKHEKQSILGKKIDVKELISDLEQIHSSFLFSMMEFEELIKREKSTKEKHYEQLQKIEKEKNELSVEIKLLKQNLFNKGKEKDSIINNYEGFIERIFEDNEFYNIEKENHFLDKNRDNPNNDLGLTL